MERDESPLLHEPDLMLAVLRVAATGQGTVDACIEQLRALRRCARVRDKVPEAEVRARLADVGAKLERARLIERAGAGQLAPDGARPPGAGRAPGRASTIRC